LESLSIKHNPLSGLPTHVLWAKCRVSQMFKLVAHNSILQKVMKDGLEIKGFQLVLIQWRWLIKTMKNKLSYWVAF